MNTLDQSFDRLQKSEAALGVSDEVRTTKALRGIVGKRLTYRGSPVAA